MPLPLAPQTLDSTTSAAVRDALRSTASAVSLVCEGFARRDEMVAYWVNLAAWVNANVAELDGRPR